MKPVDATTEAAPDAAVELYWLPLGAGGSVVRLNGRIYERLRASMEHRPPQDLYHCALVVRLPGERFVIELTPVPDGNGRSRGVICEGPVGSHLLARWRLFRYEVHCWRDGVIPDIAEAVASPQILTRDAEVVRRLLEAVTSTPTHVWGRDQLRTGDMWNSNSVISWVIAQAGMDLSLAKVPPGGRAPGWDAGLVMARGRQAAPESALSPSVERQRTLVHRSESPRQQLVRRA